MEKPNKGVQDNFYHSCNETANVRLFESLPWGKMKKRVAYNLPDLKFQNKIYQ